MFLKKSFISNNVTPILIPSVLASLERATIHPSLLLKTTMGFPISCGLKTRSLAHRKHKNCYSQLGQTYW